MLTMVQCKDDKEEIEEIKQETEIVQQDEIDDEEDQEEEIDDEIVEADEGDTLFEGTLPTVREILESFSVNNGVVSSKIFDMVTIDADTTFIVCMPCAVDATVDGLDWNFKLNFAEDATIFLDDNEIKNEDSYEFGGEHSAELKIFYDEENYREYTLKVYQFSLPVLSIQTPGNTEITSKEVWTKDATIRLWTTDGEIEDLEGTQIKGRGNTTWNYSKKPYTIKMDSKTNMIKKLGGSGSGKDKRWNLLANYMDRTLMRNHVTFELGRQTGLAWTPKGEFCELILNGEHNGNYYLCEHIKLSEDRVNIQELSATDTDPDVITGGYILEYDKNYDEVNKFKSAVCDYPVQFKEPDDDVLNTDQFNYMQDYIDEMEAVLENTDVENYYETIQDWIDIDSFIDFWIVEELAQNWEPNHPKSTYFYKDRGDVLYAGPLWDFDWETYTMTAGHTGWRLKTALYYKYLFENAEFVERVQERWNAQKAGFKDVVPEIAETRDKLWYSDELNMNIWAPITQTTNGDTELSYDEATSLMQSVLDERIDILDELINDL